MLCETATEFVVPSTEPDKRYGACGTYVGMCGFGLQRFYFKLGENQNKITTWFHKNHEDDTLEVYQYGEPLGMAQQDKLDGSFSIDYAPLSETEDEIYFVFRGQYSDSKVSFRIDCPQACGYIPPDIVLPEPTTMECGRTRYQSGFVERNTILLGGEAGWVDLIWEIDGYAIVYVHQDETLITTLKSNRSGEFKFWYDPSLGDVFFVTHGTGTVNYVVSCPYLIEAVVDPTFRFTCSTETQTFTAPKNIDVVLPNMAGVIEIRAELVETASLNFMHGQNSFYQVQQYTGPIEFTYNFDPAGGNVQIVSTGYGDFQVRVKCPQEEQPPEPVQLEAECSTTMRTFAGYSDVTFDMGNISGNVTADFIITDSEISITNGPTTVQVRSSGTYDFEFDNDFPVVVAARGNDYQVRMACPEPFPPVELTLYCGQNVSFVSPANIALLYGATVGNSVITASSDVAVYKNNVLVGVGKSVRVYADGSPIRVVSAEYDTNVTVSAACPATEVYPCGAAKTFYGGDVIDVALGTAIPKGHVTFTVVITGNVAITWRRNNATIRTSSASDTFEILHNSSDSIRLVTTGTGSFVLTATCPKAPSIISTSPQTEVATCPTGQTANGQYGGSNTITATWNVYTWSDGTQTQSSKVWNGVCMIEQDLPIPPARWGIATFSNRLFTGGPIEAEITQEELDLEYISATHAPNGTPYKHWTGFEQFVSQQMLNTVTPNNVAHDARITPTVKQDEFIYLMWDARAGNVQIIDIGVGFISVWEGIFWRNDWYGNYEGMPEYDPNLPVVMTVQYDDGNGVRPWKVMRHETTPTSGTRTNTFSIKYVV